jgi:hypothetical protein
VKMLFPLGYVIRCVSGCAYRRLAPMRNAEIRYLLITAFDESGLLIAA